MKMKTDVGPMIRLIQSRLNNCSPLIWSRNVRWDGVEEPSWSGDSTDQENVALLNPMSSHSFVVEISTCEDLSANESNSSVFRKNSVTRSNEILAERQGMRERANEIKQDLIPWITMLTIVVTPSWTKKTPIYWRRSWKLDTYQS